MVSDIGYKVVGFIHDEFIIEVPQEVNETEEIEKIEKIAIDSMSEVVANRVPIKCFTFVSRNWSKPAKEQNHIWEEEQ